MRKWMWGLLGGVMLWTQPAGAADPTLGADVGALYFWHADKVGAGVNLYPGLDAGGGFSGELRLGYELAHANNVSAVYPIYVGVRYDFADLIESNDWHPIFAAHAGMSVMQVSATPMINIASGGTGSGVSSGSDVSSTDAGLGSDVSIGLNYSASNERAVGIVLQQNWAGAANGTNASWISLGVAGRLVF